MQNILIKNNLKSNTYISSIMLSQHTDDTTSVDIHVLNDKWTLWAHLPHNTDWSLKSYIPISTFQSMEEAIAITESLPPIFVKNCMLFMMKKGIQPIWEDPKNKEGGCFSFKVLNEDVPKAWTELTYRVVGCSISKDESFIKCVSGITISPKKQFCVIKLWMSNCINQNPAVLAPVYGLQIRGCIFKKHSPEYN